MLWRDLSFRWKLLLSLTGVVLLVTIGLLVTTTRQVARSYDRLFIEGFAREITHFENARLQRLNEVQRACAAFTRQIRFIAALREVSVEADPGDTIDQLYKVVRNEFETPEIQALTISSARFYRILTADGKILPTEDERAGLTNLVQSALLEKQITNALGGAAPTNSSTHFLTLRENPARTLIELLVVPIIDESEQEFLGAIAIGFEAQIPQHDSASPKVMTGILHDDALFTRDMPGPLIEELTTNATPRTINFNGEPFRVFVSNLGASQNPPTQQISLYSRAQEFETQAHLRANIIALGAVGLICGIVLSLLLSHHLAVPIAELAIATKKIQDGQLDTRVPARGKDEMGQLSSSFNEMAAGLELKEKYRSVLEIVADKSVAEELMTGQIALGGEAREISVLFCDIRGFTALTENMNPTEVIRMLNEHFTPLTDVVYRHNGIVDKFVGDLIMAVFGAPRVDPQHALHATQCARDMILARSRLNQTSQYKIEVGIGVASGRAVAGTMGSQDRMSYTVLGERVNLAARLCSQAGRMEVILDSETNEALNSSRSSQRQEALTKSPQAHPPSSADSDPNAPHFQTVPLPPVNLKGFAHPVQAYKLQI